MLQIIIFYLALVALTLPLGLYMAKVFGGKKTFMSPVLGWLGSLLYGLCGIKKEEEMDWRIYTKALLFFNLFVFLFLFVLHHEYGNAGGARRGEHDGPRKQPDQADRNR